MPVLLSGAEDPYQRLHSGGEGETVWMVYSKNSFLVNTNSSLSIFSVKPYVTALSVRAQPAKSRM